AYQYTNGASSGTMTVTPPTQDASYEFRYFLSNQYLLAARSSATRVHNFGLTPSATSLSPGAVLIINWTAPMGRPSTDWIGLYQVGDPNTSYLSWAFTNGAASGTMTLIGPRSAGTYEFRYLLNRGYTDVAKSQTFTVQ